jgi:hypothetical protein
VYFSRDGSNYGWDFIKNEKCYVQIKEKTYGPYGDISKGHAIYSLSLYTSLKMVLNMAGYFTKKKTRVGGRLLCKLMIKLMDHIKK